MNKHKSLLAMEEHQNKLNGWLCRKAMMLGQRYVNKNKYNSERQLQERERKREREREKEREREREGERESHTQEFPAKLWDVGGAGGT